MKKVLLVLLLFVALIVYSYLLGALATWLLSLAFGFEFTWLRAFYLWLALSIITGGIKISMKE